MIVSKGIRQTQKHGRRQGNRGPNIVNRGLKVLFFGLFSYFFGLFSVGPLLEEAKYCYFSVIFANFWSFFRCPPPPSPADALAQKWLI